MTSFLFRALTAVEYAMGRIVLQHVHCVFVVNEGSLMATEAPLPRGEGSQETSTAKASSSDLHSVPPGLDYTRKRCILCDGVF